MSEHDWDQLKQKAQSKSKRPAGDWPPAWNPDDPGQELMGEVVAVYEDVPLKDYDQTGDVATIETPDGECWSLWLNRTVLQNGWNAAGPPGEGDGVLVQYLGMREGDAGREYHDYVVVSDAEPKTDRDKMLENTAPDEDKPLDSLDIQKDEQPAF